MSKEPLDEQEAQDETPPEEVIYVVEPARLLQTRELQEPRKYYLTNGVEVRIIDEVEAALDASGRKLRTVQFTTYTGEQVKTLVRDPDALRRSWAHADERERAGTSGASHRRHHSRSALMRAPHLAHTT